MALYLVNHTGSLAACLDVASPACTILLLEDGVYEGLHRERVTPLIEALRIVAIKDDVLTRGIQNRLPPSLPLISYTDFVELTEQHSPIVSWF